MKNLKQTVFYINFPISFIAFIFPIYALSVGANVIEIGFLYSIFSIMTIVVKPLVGNLIDNYGRKKGLIIGCILYIISNLMYGFASNMTLLLVSRIFQGLAATFLWISVDTVISDLSSDNNRAENFGIINQTSAQGNIIGSTIGLSIFFFQVVDNPFRISFLIYTITSLIALVYLRGVDETLKYNEENVIVNKIQKTYFYIFLMIMGIISLISSLTAPLFLIYLNDYITNDLSKIAFLFLPGAILGMFLPRKFGNLADRYGKGKIIFYGISVEAVLITFIPFIRDYGLFIIFYTLMTIINMFFAPALASIIMDFVGDNKRGKSYGLYSFATGIGAAIGPVIGTFLYEKVSSSLVFYLKGILLLIVIGFSCLLYLRGRKNEKIE